MIKKIILQIKNNSFAKNILTLFTGSVAAQAIGILVLPLLARLYSPEDFGVLGIYMSVVAIIGIIAGGGYEQAIMLPKKKAEALNILALSLILAFIVSLISFVAALLFNKEISLMLGTEEIQKWLYAVPISIFMLVAYKSLNYWFNRSGLFKNIAVSKIYKSSTNSGLAVGTGYLKYGAAGLISAWIFGHIISVFYLIIKFVKKDLNSVRLLNIVQIKELAIRYKKFPLFESWSELLRVLSIELPLILVSLYYGDIITGNYSFAFKILMIPTALITFSIGQAYYKKAIELQDNLAKLKSVTLLTIKNLLFIIVVPIAAVAVFGVEIFTFIFGSEWDLAGQYSSYMVFYILVAFISAPFTPLFSIYNKQNIKFVFYAISTFFQIGTLVVLASFFKYSSDTVIAVFFIVSSILRFIYIVLILKNIEITFLELTLLIIKYFLPIFILFLLFKKMFL